MDKHNHLKIEKKWQRYWEKKKIFEVKEDPKKKKFYALIEFPYPSGAGLHVGHPRSYTAMDILARQKRMGGYNVLYPIGFDSFGLPTENYAIKTGRPPAEITKENIANFTRQLKMLGFSFDWSRVVVTSEPEYYRWTQWIFLQFFKRGLAYKKSMPVNWCLSCKIGLANEEAVNGVCERCGGPVEKRDKEQWMLAITKYADKLLAGLKEVDYIPEVKIQQENWIGRSEGAMIEFRISNSELRIEVFTTRPDTLFGATYMVVAPEHPLVASLLKIPNPNPPAGGQIPNTDNVKKYIEKTRHKTDLERTDLAKEKTGVELKGIKVVNPVNGEELPIFVADYVLTGYGTGAIMAVPAHDQRDMDFARKYHLPVKAVIKPVDKDIVSLLHCYIDKNIAFEEEGININSELLNGLETKEAKKKMISWLEEKGVGKREVQYKLRDWVFSRQRYWGEPIPLVKCEKCGWVPVPEKDLPLKLPEVKRYQPTDTGESPLSALKDWVNTTCPKCSQPAKRETDTMPNWAGSSWYFLRYCDPRNEREFASMKKLEYWMPVDWYNGGMEHVVLHLLYSRFWNQFLHDIGAVPASEPYRKRTSHGMILGEDGEKMSKSRGNVINPDEIVQKFGADAFRTYIMFMGPFDQACAWSTKGVVGVRRFLDRVWGMQEKFQISNFKFQIKSKIQNPKSKIDALDRLLNKTIKKVTEDIGAMKFNTAISALMILANEMSQARLISNPPAGGQYPIFLKLLSPFAPHLAEELWSRLGHKNSIAKESWPVYDPALIKDEEIELVVQISGKVRERLKARADLSEAEAKEMVLASKKVQKWLAGKEIKKFVYIQGRLVNLVIE